MTPAASIKTCFAKYINFSGRAPMSEFWYFYLFSLVPAGVLTLVGRVLVASDSVLLGVVGTVGGFVWLLVLFMPSLAVGVRRLHDADHSGLWYLVTPLAFLGLLVSHILDQWFALLIFPLARIIFLAIFVGSPILMLYFWAAPGNTGPNRYGIDPLRRELGMGPYHIHSPRRPLVHYANCNCPVPPDL